MPPRVEPWAYRVHRALRPVVRVATRGDRRQCNVCGSRCRRFLAHRDITEAVCPVCLSHGRHRIGWAWLASRSGLDRGRWRVLHLAPEPEIGGLLRAWPNVDVVSADLASPLADLRTDVARLGLADESFDAVICSHVLEHVPSDRRALRELRRILRPGGWILIQVPLPSGQLRTDEDPSVTSPAERTRRFGQADHCRLYGMDLVDRIREAGLEVESLLAETLFDEPARQRLCLRADEPLFIARRPEPVRATHSRPLVEATPCAS
jgi:SAM-dependent methyltransferase